MIRAATALLLGATLLAALVFTLWPGIDLMASAPFHDAATGTWLAETPALAFLREALWTGMELATIAFLLLFLLALAPPVDGPARGPVAQLVRAADF